MGNNKEKTDRSNPENLKAPFGIEDTINEINTHICKAQTHLLSRSRDIIIDIEKEEINLPTVYQQVVNEEGQSEIKKVSDIKIPFGYFLTPGVFQISKVDVEIPFKIEMENKPAKTDIVTSLKKNESNLSATLRLSYEYVQLNNYTVPAFISSNPFIEVRFLDFSIDPKFKARCTAHGLIEVKNEKTGIPLARQKIYLNLEEGSIVPTEGTLDDSGKLEFKISSTCLKDQKLATNLTAIINGVKRKLSILLTQ